ncbi:glycoside hydrolase family 7 protein [Patellaria atrata CBS 101060]|uniref:Glucanase n=1 Tax=Patellaria atrata CBS 101060 TaxID=1346257 RepID=A0A9P4S5C6_9PEZI|nr:glycoside hydrolase family 7 protein [Patellaria atrata CBS 101060]
MKKSLPTLFLLTASVVAQQKGTQSREVHPLLPSQYCTRTAGCQTINSSVVLDSNYRWTHTTSGFTNCATNGVLSPEICPDPVQCGKNCALEGADYQQTYGIRTEGDALTLNLYVSPNGELQMSSPRVYLLENSDTYRMFKLLNQEFTYDVDVSKVPCGVNGALYFSEMDAKGGQSDINPAGAAYGTGYCDAQCPRQLFLNGTANLENKGACCNEMDIWEANNAANAYTPHPCNITSIYGCTGTLCGGGGDDRYKSVCDADGCDYNPYRQGNHNFYGPNMTVDTNKKFTVVTQFLTKDNSADGPLSEIRRLYVQDGRVIENSVTTVEGLDSTNSITDEYCTEQKDLFQSPQAFSQQGGLEGMGDALGRGMVLAMSIWNDAGGRMKWLDGTYPPDADPSTAPGTGRGPCAASTGDPATLMQDYPDARVIFSNIKSGEIGTTFSASNSTLNGRRYMGHKQF